MPNGLLALRTMEALSTVDDDADVSAYLVGAIYELARRLDETPRSIADKAFCSLASDEAWRDKLEPYFRDHFGRD